MTNKFGWAVILVLLALIGVSWIAYSKEPAGQTDILEGLKEAPIAGYLAPDFTLTSTTGDTIALSDFRGKPLVLNFWASWCPPCRSEIPHFQRSSVKYEGQAAILGIDQGEPLPVVADFGAAFGVTYPLLLDSDNSVNRQYAVTALPSTIFVDGKGVVREVYTGIVNLAVLEDRIEKLLAEG